MNAVDRSASGADASSVPVRLFALASGVIVLSLYAAQPLVGAIGASLHLSGAAMGLANMLTLTGYAGGLFVLVPLCDRYENRRLVLLSLLLNVLALALAALPLPAAFFLGTSFLIGISASAIQMLIPMAAAMTPEAQRGRVIGDIMSGLLLGVMLSRPLASLLGGAFGWRTVYGGMAAAVALLFCVLAPRLARRQPSQPQRVTELLGTMLRLLREEATLRVAAIDSALCFAAFTMFWGIVALRLAAAPFRLGAVGIAVFALAGVGGMLAAPIAGRLGDRGMGRGALRAAHLGIAIACLLAWLAGSAWAAATWPRWLDLWLLGAAAILLDAGTIADQALNRRAINLLQPQARGRINGLFTGIFFLGGAAGSALAGLMWSQAGWAGVCVTALLIAGGALLAERLPSKTPRRAHSAQQP